MANFTTAAQVRSILGDSVDDSVDLAPWIDSAHVLVEKWCPAYDASAQPDGYTAAQLEMIERWLAAHCYVTSPDSGAAGGKTLRERAGEVEEEYQRQVLGPGLEATPYGLMALRFDWRGSL